MSRELAKVLRDSQEILETRDKPLIRATCVNDLFFLLHYICGRKDMANQWLLDRCDEVHAEHDGILDLWPRFHYKSTIITFGLLMQEALSDPEVTIVILSRVRQQAISFLKQIMREFESNQLLQEFFDDVLWADPRKEAPVWSESGGVVLRRESNPKEPTISAAGLIDGQPTGMHFAHRHYDDVVTKETVSTEEMRENVLDSLRLSFALKTPGGKASFCGTRYHYADPYQSLIDDGIVRPREHKVQDGNGVPVFLSPGQLEQIRKELGAVQFAAQMMMDPLAAGQIRFKREWLRFYRDPMSIRGNVYLLVDPANSKKKYSDYTVAIVVVLGADNNYYVVDIVRDRLSLSERWKLLVGLHRMWKPLRTFYEQYGKETDTDYFAEKMQAESYRFELTVMAGTRQSKADRIEGLIPLFESSRIWLQDSLHRLVTASGKDQDLVKVFVDAEFVSWPLCQHDDMLDCLARVKDPSVAAEMAWPKSAAVDWFGRTAPSRVAVGTGEVAGF